jgi:hypothetical protein
VAAVCILELVELWSETRVVAYPDDSAMHSELVRFATAQYQAGHFPLVGWFPYLNVGSPLFIHYQSLPAMAAGLLGLVIGPDHAFTWSTYLLVALWPISVFIGARLMRLTSWAAAAAGCLAPFIVSAPSLGYEQGSYLWIGFGLWTQLWAMWTLPIAWGYSWRAVTEGRHLFGAVLFTALTMCLHFMTGYLAIAAPVLFFLVKPTFWGRRLWRVALVVGGSLAVAAWAVVPLIALGRYMAINEFLLHTSHADSFGARRVLSWLAEGDLFDFGRLPVITTFAGLGLVFCLWRIRRDERARALVPLFVASLLLFFGRPTWGSALRFLPGSADLFLRRFVMGVQMSGLLLAGVGAVGLARLIVALVRRYLPALERSVSRPRLVPARRALVGLACAAALLPGPLQLHVYDAKNAADIAYQHQADLKGGAEVDAVLAKVRTLPPGRVYAGLPYDNWGQHFFVGYAMVLQYLTTASADEVGFTLRTASLMSNPEVYFDEYVPGDYKAFAVRYLILPRGRRPSVHADLVMTSGPYSLWSVPGVGYVQLVDTIPPIPLDRGDIGQQTAWWLRSSLPTRGLYPTVAYEGAAAATPTTDGRHDPRTSAGTVLSEHVDLADGVVSVRVRAERSAVALLSESYDPGWTATVDGHAQPTEMVVPALVGVKVAAGVHTVTFRFEGPSYEPFLVAFSLLVLAAVAGLEWARRRRRRFVTTPRERSAVIPETDAPERSHQYGDPRGE